MAVMGCSMLVVVGGWVGVGRVFQEGRERVPCSEFHSIYAAIRNMANC